MKILMFNYEYPPLGGGGGVIHKQIADELAQRHKVVVVTSHFPGLARQETVSGVEVHRVIVKGRNSLDNASLRSMLSFFPACMKRGQEIIDVFKPDFINTHFAVPTGPAAVMLAQRNRIPHALCIHGGDIFDPSKRLSPHRTPGLRQTVRWVLRRVDRVLAASHNTAENAKRIYGVPDEIVIIPHGIKMPARIGFDRSELGLSDEQTVLVTVGRLVARKAHHQLIEILARIQDTSVVLVVIGDGPERKRLLRRAEQLNVAHRIFMPGVVSENRKLQFLEASDVFVSTTLHEGFGLMYLEAMFCGLPVVTYDHGGQSDFLKHGSTGYLAPVNNQDEFRTGLELLFKDRALRRTMGEYNRELSQSFTIEHCASQYEAEFEQMLSSRVNRLNLC